MILYFINVTKWERWGHGHVRGPVISVRQHFIILGILCFYLFGHIWFHQSQVVLIQQHEHFIFLAKNQTHAWQKSLNLQQLSILKATKLWGQGSIPVMAWSGKAGSCLPLVGSLQYRTLTNCMYWFPLPFQLPVVIWPVQCWKQRKTPNK